MGEWLLRIISNRFVAVLLGLLFLALSASEFLDPRTYCVEAPIQPGDECFRHTRGNGTELRTYDQIRTEETVTTVISGLVGLGFLGYGVHRFTDRTRPTGARVTRSPAGGGNPRGSGGRRRGRSRRGRGSNGSGRRRSRRRG